MRRAALVSFALQSLAIGTNTALSPESDTSVSRLDARSFGDASFDYVVVGGGTGGNVIATRLAQKSLRVALVEAGGLYELESVAAVPAADVLPVGSDPSTKALHDWGFVAEKVPGANGRSVHYARGKCLGGSYVFSFKKICRNLLMGASRSAMNFMIYQRSVPFDMSLSD